MEADSLDVHHKHYSSLGAESADDLLVLCKRCHGAQHKNHFQSPFGFIGPSGECWSGAEAIAHATLLPLIDVLNDIDNECFNLEYFPSVAAYIQGKRLLRWASTVSSR